MRFNNEGETSTARANNGMLALLAVLFCSILCAFCLASAISWADEPVSGSSSTSSGESASSGSSSSTDREGSGSSTTDPESSSSSSSTDPENSGSSSGTTPEEPNPPQDQQVTLAVSSGVATVSVSPTAQATVHGAPGDADFSVNLTIVMGDSLYDQVVYPTVSGGTVSDATAWLSGGAFSFSLANANGATAFANGQPITMRFHRADADVWIERQVTIDVQAGTVAIAGAAVNTDIVKVLIAALPHDPYDIYGDADGSIARAQTAYNLLSADEQALLDQELVVKDGREISRSYGRYLEQAVWALSSLSGVDNSTTLPDGTYTGKVAGESNMGKSTSQRAKKFRVVSITVENGRAMALLEHDSDASATLRIGGQEYENINPSGKSRYRVPIDLNSTFYFSAKGKGATDATDAIVYEMTATIDEASAQPDKPGEGESDDGQSGDGSGTNPDGKTDAQLAREVSDIIALLPKARAVTVSDQAAIESARAAYDKLTDKQKVLVENASRLEAAESALVLLIKDSATDDPGNDGKTPDNTQDSNNSNSAVPPADNGSNPPSNSSSNGTTPRQSTNLAFNMPTTGTTATTANTFDPGLTTGTQVSPSTQQSTSADPVVTVGAQDTLESAQSPLLAWLALHMRTLAIVGLLVCALVGVAIFSVFFVNNSKLKY